MKSDWEKIWVYKLQNKKVINFDNISFLYTKLRSTDTEYLSGTSKARNLPKNMELRKYIRKVIVIIGQR